MRYTTCVSCGRYLPHYAKGQCHTCYTKALIESLPEKMCTNCGQKDKKIRLGLCRKCYKQQWNEQNMPHVLEYTAQWVQEHPERRSATSHRYRISLKGKVAHLLQIITRSKRIRDAGGDGLTTDQWNAILDAHGHRCYYCGASGKMTIEHKTPLVRGGTHEPSNIVPACGKCNLKKGTMTAEEFIEKLKGEAE